MANTPVADNATARPSATLGACVALLRPRQWVKNIVVFAGPAASLQLASFDALLTTLVAFGSFCLAASSIYAINDIIDREVDAKHPTKRFRPIACGAISPGVASVMAGCLLSLSILFTVMINTKVTAILVIYFVMMLTYSLALKKAVILDVIILATGFVLRAWAGTAAVDVVASEWLIGCVFTLCLFFGFGKRRCEITMLGDQETAGQHRETLVRYTPQLLSHLITVSAAIAVVTFLLYTMDTGRITAPFHKEHLFYTLPIVVYGIFRYAMQTELGIHSGPTEIILNDRMLLASIVLWVVIAMGIAYHDQLVGWVGMDQWIWGPTSAPQP